MAGPSGDDVPTQLATLLGKEGVQIRKTEETPPRASVIDVISAFVGKDPRRAAEQLRRLVAQYPQVDTNCVLLKFPGRGERDTPQNVVLYN